MIDRVIKLSQVPVGSRIHYSGDVANQAWWGTVIEHVDNHVIVEINNEGRVFRTLKLSLQQIGTVYRGHCDPRFVTEVAYKLFVEHRQMEAFEREVMKHLYIESDDELRAVVDGAGRVTQHLETSGLTPSIQTVQALRSVAEQLLETRVKNVLHRCFDCGASFRGNLEKCHECGSDDVGPWEYEMVSKLP